MVRMDSQSLAIISGVENHHRGLGNSSSWLHFQWPAPLNTHCRSVPHSFPREGLLQESHLQVFRSPRYSGAGQHGPSLPDSCRGDKALQLLNRGPDNSHFTAFYNLIAFILVILSTRLSPHPCLYSSWTTLPTPPISPRTSPPAFFPSPGLLTVSHRSQLELSSRCHSIDCCSWPQKFRYLAADLLLHPLFGCS